MKNCKTIAIVNQKGGVGKTTTCANLGIGLARCGVKVLLIDADAQGSLTASLGYQPDELKITLSTIIGRCINDESFPDSEGILQHEEGEQPNTISVDLLPSNIDLAGVESSIVGVMCRESILRQYINQIKHNYDYILIDCMPSLGMMTINALTAADSVLIPVQPQYLPIKGLEQLLKTINHVRKNLNSNLSIDGILLTMVDTRTKYAKELIKKLHEAFDGHIKIFENSIPLSVRASETSADGVSIYSHDPNGKVSGAYEALTLEVAGL